MSYVIEQKIGNHIYFYEVTSYWDAQKKQPRQKRKYLGKKDPATGQLRPPRPRRTPRLAKDYGQVYLLQAVAEQIGLPQILKTIFPVEYRTLLALAFFEISEAEPLYLFPYWVESTSVTDVLPLSSRELTTFTQHLGRLEHERLEFSQQWVKQAGPVQAVAFDITSLSSYSELLEYVEWGYNRNDEPLPQINLGIIYAENRQLPLHYQVYPGSIPDVSTLKNLLNYLELFKLTDLVFVMDRGLYSAANLGSLAGSQISFVLPMPRSVNLFFTLLAEHTRQLSNLAHAFLFKDEVLVHVQVPTEVNHVALQAHLYFDPHSHGIQTDRFLKTILETETAANGVPFHTRKEARQYLSGLGKGRSQYFQVTAKTGQIKITRNPKTLSKRMANMGATIMLTNHQGLGRETILDLYRRKDYLEKTFDVLKNEFDGKRLRGHSREAVEGRLFIKFLSLILYAALGNTMRKQQLFKQYSVKELMYELKKLKIVELNNGQSYLTELSKRQKEIFKKFAIAIPKI